MPVRSARRSARRADGQVIPTPQEHAEQQARAQRQRADAAEAELARLRALLARQGPSDS